MWVVERECSRSAKRLTRGYHDRVDACARGWMIGDQRLRIGCRGEGIREAIQRPILRGRLLAVEPQDAVESHAGTSEIGQGSDGDRLTAG